MSRLSLLAAVCALSPADAEERTFSVALDGKPAGSLVLTFTHRDDGTTAVTVKVDAKADRPAYSLAYQGTESWKDGRLVRLEGSGSEAGRKGGVTLRAGPDGYALKAGVKEVTVRGEVWPTTFAVRPDADRPLVLDVVTGDVFRAKAEKAGKDRVTVGDRPVPATRYRVTFGGQVTDLWYDEKDRLVRRAWTRDGSRFVLELAGVKGER